MPAALAAPEGTTARGHLGAPRLRCRQSVRGNLRHRGVVAVAEEAGHRAPALAPEEPSLAPGPPTSSAIGISRARHHAAPVARSRQQGERGAKRPRVPQEAVAASLTCSGVNPPVSAGTVAALALLSARPVTQKERGSDPREQARSLAARRRAQAVLRVWNCRRSHERQARARSRKGVPCPAVFGAGGSKAPQVFFGVVADLVGFVGFDTPHLPIKPVANAADR